MGGGGSILEALLAMLLADKMGLDVSASSAPSSPEVEAMRAELRAALATDRGAASSAATRRGG